MQFHLFENVQPLFQSNPYNQHQFGSSMAHQTEDDFDHANIVLIGVTEADYEEEANLTREAIYKLHKPSNNAKLYDLGNFQLLPNEQFSIEQLTNVVAELFEYNKTVVVFGGSTKTMYSLQRAFAMSKQYMNAAIIQPNFEFSQEDADTLTDENYLLKLTKHPNSYLFNFSQIGLQQYLLNPENLMIQKELNFTTMRLGALRDDIKETEPLLRDVNLLGVSLNALKYSESGGQKGCRPNGLYSEELAQLMRYAGMSDQLQCLGLFQFQQTTHQQPKIGAQVFAEAFWCFVEAFAERKREWPEKNDKNFIRYTVSNDEYDLELIFLKSELSGRWWIQMPKDKAMLKKKFYIPCSYSDYKTALEGDIPERWLNGFNKLG